MINLLDLYDSLEFLKSITSDRESILLSMFSNKNKKNYILIVKNNGLFLNNTRLNFSLKIKDINHFKGAIEFFQFNEYSLHLEIWENILDKLHYFIHQKKKVDLFLKKYPNIEKDLSKNKISTESNTNKAMKSKLKSKYFRLFNEEK